LFSLGVAGGAIAGEKLIFGVDNKDWGGHYAWENDQLTGLDADIVRIAAKKLGREVVFEPYPWKRVIQMAESREVDAVLDLAPTDLRKRFLHYSEVPVSLEATVFWVKKGSTFSFKGTMDKRLRLGLMAGSDWSDRFMKHGTPTVVRFNSYEAAFRNLAAGRVDAFGAYYAPTWQQAENVGFSNIIKASKPILDNLTYYVAFTQKPGHRELAVQFSEALRKFFRSSEYTALLKKYGVCDMENPLDYATVGSH